MSTIREYYNRFKQWQRNPFSYRPLPRHWGECINCGTTFAGGYCPSCGQKAGPARLTWKSMLANSMDVWGLGSRSLPRNVVHLLLRPGYLINDYLHGRRQPYFPPVKSLFLTVALLLLVMHLLGVEQIYKFDGNNTSFNRILSAIANLQVRYMAFAEMLTAGMLACLLRLFFNHSPRQGDINLCECVYTQVWVAMLTTIVNIVLLPIFTHSGWYPGRINYIETIFIFFAYKQLFGFSWFSTLWRTLSITMLALFLTVLIEILIAVTILLITDPAALTHL